MKGRIKGDDLSRTLGDPLEGRVLKNESSRPLRRRASAERQRTIAAEAAGYFAEHGFDGNTRALAKRLGVSQALLFKYFPTKRDLMNRIYDDVFVGRWNPAWETWIEDESSPLEQRICRFYLDYARVILSYEWVRLYMFSSLKGFDLAKRYSKVLRARIFPRVVAAIRSSNGMPPLDEVGITDQEMEIVASLHAAIFYLGVRQWVYNIPLENDIDAIVTTKVRAFLLGASAVFGEALKPARSGRGNAVGRAPKAKALARAK
jgi:AcrR family transcriptional regulator